MNRHRAIFVGILGSAGSSPDLLPPGHGHARAWSADGGTHVAMAVDLMQRVASDPRMVGRAFFYVLDSKPRPDGDGGELGARLDELMRRLLKSRFAVRTGMRLPGRLTDRVRRDLLGIIDRLFPPTTHVSRIDAERRAHAAYAERRRDGYVEMASYLDTLDDYVERGGDPLVVTGATGAGKSSLLAYWTGRFRREHPAAFIIEHYVGAGSSGGGPSDLMRRIMAEIRERYGLVDDIPIGVDPDASAMKLWLAKVQREQLVLVIDALDQLGGDADPFDWLPEYFPPNVRLVVSVVEGAPLDALASRGWPTIAVKPLSAAQRRAVINRVLGDSGRGLTAKQLRLVSRDHPAGNMLFLRTRLEELRTSVTDEKLNQRIDHYRDVRDLDDLFQRVLRRFEMEHDAGLVRDVMSLVWGSRRGLSYAELRGLTGAGDAELSDLLGALDFHLMRRDGLYTFFHEHMRCAVEASYISGGGASRKKLHARLASYFAKLPASVRRADEEPWQWLQAGDLRRLKGCVVDIPIFMDLAGDDRKYDLLEYWRAIGSKGQAVEEYGGSFERFGAVEADPLRIASVLMALGRFFFDLGHYRDAERACRRALELRLDLLGNGHLDTAESMEELGSVCLYESKHSEAHYHFQCALGIKELLLGRDHELTARSVAKWGVLLHLTGKFDRALPVLDSAIEQCGRALGPEHPETISALNNLAATFSALGDHRKAASILESTLAINERARGEQQIETAKNVLNLGVQYKFLGDFHLAERLYGKALGILTDLLGPDHPEIARCLTNLGTLFKETRRLEKAEELYRSALAIRITALGEDHLDTHNSWLNIAAVCTEQDRFPEARRIYRRSLPAKLKILGEGHPAVIQSQRQYETFLRKMRKQRRRGGGEARGDA
jgi:tetratricopeptide (TPR) repeat protein